jgi:hypothetical protein
MQAKRRGIVIFRGDTFRSDEDVTLYEVPSAPEPEFEPNEPIGGIPDDS